MKEMLYQLSYLDMGAGMISFPHKGARLTNQFLVLLSFKVSQPHILGLNLFIFASSGHLLYRWRMLVIPARFELTLPG